MNRYKKVSGERIAAAVIDSILVSIVGFILILIWYLFTLDFDNLLDSFITSSSYGGEGYVWYLVYTTVSSTLFGFIYFVLIPWKWNGQTLAKKMLKIKAVTEFGDNPSLWQHFLRSIQNYGGYVLVLAAIFLFIDEDIYLIFATVIGLLTNLVIMIGLIMILARDDGRGFHDMIAGTMVVKADEDFNKEFAMKTAQMGEWAEIVDQEDQGFIEEENKDDEWDI